MTSWAVLLTVVGVALTVDLLLHRRWPALTLRQAGAWTAVWVTLGLAFGVFVLADQGATAAGEYYATYLVEWSLSIDNVFVFAALFAYFGVPREHQHRVLFWGVLGALVLRLVFVLVGVELLERFHWTQYTLGAFVVLAGFWMLWRSEEADPRQQLLIRLVGNVMPVTPEFDGDRFFVRRNGKRVATPLFVLLLVIAPTDVSFAIDSIPTALAITSNAFVVFASNAFAVIGLRSLYFVVVGAMSRFEYLHYGLSAVLLFVGTKLLLSDVIGEVPIGLSLGVIVAAIGGSLIASEVARRRRAQEEERPAATREAGRVRSGA
ncbi:MAG TPA: TerC/Alx family metal homeostasis membrane protein [Gaiellaceae bacterium]|nr:TerC/Alx family metal homeostasis membrane protein [Gaiellaceae bacterium]